MKKLIISCLAMTALALLAGCSSDDDDDGYFSGREVSRTPDAQSRMQRPDDTSAQSEFDKLKNP